MRNPLFTIALLCTVISGTALARSKENKRLLNLHDRLTKVESSLERMEGELAILKTQSRLVIRRTTVGFLNAWYLKGNLSILLPRKTSFSSSTDTGLGAHVGLGRYLGRNNVFDLSFDWDLYPSVTFRYRLEFHNNSPNISIGPVLGIKQKLFDKDPFDNFIGNPNEIKSTFFVIGGYMGFPLSKSVLTTEINALINGQFILTFTAGLHFFL